MNRLFAFFILLLLVACVVPMPAPSSLSPTVVPSPVSSVAPTLIPARPLTELEAIDQEMKSGYGPVHLECGTCTRSSDVPINCTQYLWTKPLTRTEWTGLFPRAHFYLIGTNLIQNAVTNRYGYQQRYYVIAQQGDKRYQAETFDQFLGENGIVITDTNRELIAKSFGLMTLGNYFENDIVFSKGEEIDEPARFKRRFNYGITASTKIQGLKFRFRFWFYKGYPMLADWHGATDNVEDFVDVPYDIIADGYRVDEVYFRYGMEKAWR